MKYAVNQSENVQQIQCSRVDNSADQFQLPFEVESRGPVLRSTISKLDSFHSLMLRSKRIAKMTPSNGRASCIPIGEFERYNPCKIQIKGPKIKNFARKLKPQRKPQKLNETRATALNTSASAEFSKSQGDKTNVNLNPSINCRSDGNKSTWITFYSDRHAPTVTPFTHEGTKSSHRRIETGIELRDTEGTASRGGCHSQPVWTETVF